MDEPDSEESQVEPQDLALVQADTRESGDEKEEKKLSKSLLIFIGITSALLIAIVIVLILYLQGRSNRVSLPNEGGGATIDVAPEPIVDRAIVDSLLEEAFEKPITGESIQENVIIVIDDPSDDLEVPRVVVDVRQDFDQDEEEIEEISVIPEPQEPT